ncbi:Peptidoglycan/LPS O-acetylase OafA/YrhL, contains acyltransferase and SGNH-hydrolase domains [Ruania alba]|uniref:Peptidoglycan/LPS O-acetylase OafA/YrhL, contains acyltransferase and SGNH-hydrolase domains n=1 Tax=Ruania alba TaxID=648782 RepID=A0A1H5NAJ6_9MICO|nr:acyltransferase family protein [Ruania alba]SEE98669.1 Peptidoglycan/LPS O-acetylase OafA/YrhL, contains acyltransferase and SGNH-hydrolase domains [Ruania alba]
MSVPAVESRTSRGSGGGFRPDIEGLRAVAIGLVLLYHAEVVELVPGGFVGVDVFFVISGFLITGLLIRELERSGRVSLGRFYARRAKRLLPATGVVLVVTAVLTWLSVSVVQWRVFGGDIVGAALYVVNWVLAGRSVDYLAEDVGVSPVQHFWSLAVEEQFYIVWPLLLVLVGWWVRRRTHARLRPVMAVAIGVVIVPSFVISLVWTASNPAVAFFVTPTRLWELGIGAFVAIGAPLWPRVPARVAWVLGWFGLVAVVVSAVVLTEQVAWPGYAALWPTVATALVIVAGFTSGRWGAASLLAWKPAVWVGGLSYSLYLWHWPLLVTATNLWGELGGKKGLLVAAASFVPAYLSYRLVENPLRFSKGLSGSNRLSLSLGGNFTLVGVVAGLVLVLAVPTSTTNPEQGGGQGQAAGAAVLGSAATGGGPTPGSVASLAEVEWYTPGATEAVTDVPPSYARGCQQDQESTEVRVCELGDPDGAVTLVVVGDSKILQWWSAIDQIAQDQGWRIISMTKSACGFHAGMQIARGDPYASCAEWNENVLAEILEIDPDAVLTSQRRSMALADPTDVSTESMPVMVDALTQHWQRLRDAGIPVIALLDNPSPGGNVYECVADNLGDLELCEFDRAEGVAESGAPALVAAAERVPGVQTIDMTELICPGETCVPVIGNVLLYRQSSHLTDTYVRSLANPLADELVPAVTSATG